MFKHGELLVVSILVGSIARALILRIDYRQFPSYPHSYLIHLTLGAIASTLGALFIPALLAKEYIAVTFLTIGAQQFRDVRSLERDSLNSIEKTELIPRGTAYIEGIAKLFEARNYLALLTALITSLIYYYSDLLWAVIGGVVFAYTLHYFMQGITIAEIAEVKIVPLNIKGMNIGIEQTIILNVGEKSALKKWQEEGIGIKIVPKDENARATLANLGQRQAIIHDLSILMGIKLDQGMQQFTPLARLDLDNGTLNLIIIPQEPDPVFIQKAIKQIPVLESSQRKPLKSKYGQKAAD
ncbi:MAG: YIEGIA family protein [Halanaerobiales bacterium]|nr:YIEGIA family protein [Halanaerobiales bacterium]